MFQIHDIDLQRLNSATKYPSIPTYHPIADRGMLQPGPLQFTAKVFATEKIDGTNSRIIVLPDGGYLIGSREELLHYRGDVVFNPSQSIVESIRPLADQIIAKIPAATDRVTVLFLETFGGNIGSGAKNYTSSNKTGFRLFDIAEVPLSILEMQAERISGWRENGGQSFWTAEDLVNRFAEGPGKGMCELVPSVATIEPMDMPQSIEATHQWLKDQMSVTRAVLDDGAKKRPEGLVVRTADRKQIAKIRHEDYERTLRHKK